MNFGERVRELRKGKNLSQRELADQIGVSFTYLSKIENGKLDFASFPSEDTIRKLADALDAEVDELLLMAKKIPQDIRDRVIEKPDAFRKLAQLDDDRLEQVIREIEDEEGEGKGKKK